LELNRVVELVILARLDLSSQIRIWENFQHDQPPPLETLHTKIAINELSFLLVTHTAYFETRFGRHGLLKSGYGAELFWIAWILE
jgi:hypothetical protein